MMLKTLTLVSALMLTAVPPAIAETRITFGTRSGLTLQIAPEVHSHQRYRSYYGGSSGGRYWSHSQTPGFYYYERHYPAKQGSYSGYSHRLNSQPQIYPLNSHHGYGGNLYPEQRTRHRFKRRIIRFSVPITK